MIIRWLYWLWPVVLTMILGWGGIAFLEHQVVPNIPAKHQAQAITLSTAHYDFSKNSLWDKSFTVKLPHTFRDTHKNAYYMLYRFYFEAEYLQQQWALYIPSLDTNAQIYVNGIMVGNEGSKSPPISVHRNYPLYLRLPSTTLIAKNNTLDIMVAAENVGEGKLSPIYIAAESAIKSKWESQYFIQIDAIKMITALLATTALFCFCLYYFVPQEAELGWFGALLSFYVLYNLTYLSIDSPSYIILRHLIPLASIIGICAFTVEFVNRYFSVRQPRLENGVCSLQRCPLYY